MLQFSIQYSRICRGFSQHRNYHNGNESQLKTKPANISNILQYVAIRSRLPSHFRFEQSLKRLIPIIQQIQSIQSNNGSIHQLPRDVVIIMFAVSLSVIRYYY